MCERIIKIKTTKSNPIAGLYPFAKLWIMLLYFITVIILATAKYNGYPFYMAAALAILLILTAATGITVKFMRIFLQLMFLAALILAVQSLLIPGEVWLWSRSVFSLFTLRIYENGLQRGIGISFNILCIGGIFVWFFGCTESKELVCACEKRGMNPKAGYVLLSTLQMITVLQQSSKVIMSAQEARGVETRGSLRVRMAAFMPSLIPLVLGAINSTEERALTLESKGFTAKCPKTRLFDVVPNGREKAAVIAAAVVTALVLLWRIVFYFSAAGEKVSLSL